MDALLNFEKIIQKTKPPNKLLQYTSEGPNHIGRPNLVEKQDEQITIRTVH